MNIVRSSVAWLIVLGGAAAACSNASPTAEPTGSSAQAIKTVTVFHSSQNGGDASGSVSWVNAESHSVYNLQFDAWENKTGKARTASLSFYGYGASTVQVCYSEQICSSWNYDTWNCDAVETVQYCYYQQMPYYISGYGDIPTDDFRVGVHTAHLTTDLANNPSFSAQRCGYDANWNYTCTAVTSGTFDVIWRDNGSFSKEDQGTWSSTGSSPWGSYTTRSTGHGSTTSADVSGTAMGDAVNTWGMIGLSKGTSISKDVIQGPPPPSDGGLPPPDGGPPPPPAPDGGL